MESIISISKMYLFNPQHQSTFINVSLETDPKPKNGLDPGSTETVSQYSTTLVVELLSILYVYQIHSTNIHIDM